MFIAQNVVDEVEPLMVQQAMSSPKWLAAMKLEYDALLTNGTWSLVLLPDGKSVVASKWVFWVKRKPDGSFDKFKVRLVANGYSQRPSFDYFETFSLVVKPATIIIVLTLAVT